MGSNKLLYWPVWPVRINQRFNDDDSCVSTDGKNTVITKKNGAVCPPGYKDLYADGRHGALDLAAAHGQPVYAAQRGTVYFIDTHPQSGLDVRIESFIGGRRLRHIYEHLNGYQAKVGDIVETGQLIGWADNTGFSSGDHLHFQVEELVGDTWIKIDPEPLMASISAQDALKLNHTLLFLKEQVALLADSVANFMRKYPTTQP